MPRLPNQAMLQPNPWTACSSISASRRCSSTAAERGFSYAQDAPLDMRMDPTSALTAAEIVNSYDEARAGRHPAPVRRGAIRPAHRRADRPPPCATRRSPRPRELVEIVYQAIPAPARRTGGHPAKRTFQALRIAVNGELDALRDALARGAGRAGRRRAHRGDGVSVAGGPHRQAGVRRGRYVEHTVGPAGRTPRARTAIHFVDTRCRTCRRRRGPAEPAQCRGATACRTTRRWNSDIAGAARKGGHEGQARSATASRRRSASRAEQCLPEDRAPADGPDAGAPRPPARRESVSAGPRATGAAIRAADHADVPAGRAAGPAEERQPGQGTGQGAESQGAQGCSASLAGPLAQPSWRRSTCGRAPLVAKVPFVVLVIGSLGAGLGVTLWLSTDSAERSYQLGSARQKHPDYCSSRRKRWSGTCWKRSPRRRWPRPPAAWG